jgi:hypothetical protein
VTTASARKRRLESLIAQHNLTTHQVASLVGRSHRYVLAWRRGDFDIAPELLRLLELELAHGGAVERVQMNAAIEG